MKKLIRFILLLLILAGVGFWGYNAVINRQININKLFLGGGIVGVDVSSYQENVDFGKLKEQGVEFAYIKATEGATHVDTSFAAKWADADSAGVESGAYHYFVYNVSGAEQAENFIRTVGDLNGRLIPAVDMELTPAEVQNPPAVDDVVRGLKSFLAVVEEKYGVKPLIYSQKDYYDKYLAADFAEYPRWARNVYYPIYIDLNNDWTVWQYNDHGEMDGYSGEKYIDMNVLNGTVGLEGIRYKK